MVLHIGGECFVATQSVVAILNYEGMDISSIKAELCVLEGEPRSVVVTSGTSGDFVYISPIRSATLAKRSIRFP